jgi:hypothetical protein
MKATRCSSIPLAAAAGMLATLMTCRAVCQQDLPASQATSTLSTETRPAETVRQPAVAGLFYPADPKALSEMIDGFLAQAKTPPLDNLRGLVCPHAGYPYSGPTAATAYKLLVGRDIRTVIILAPSHHADFSGAFVPNVSACRTPLGVVKVSPLARQLATVAPFTDKVEAQVQRPPWWRQSPASAPDPGLDTPDTWEHSDEVQLPFLQRTLKDFQVVLVIFGRVDPAAVARALEDRIDKETLVIASSDLSHYSPYQTACEMDRKCLDAVGKLDVGAEGDLEACGKGPILTLMHLARAKGWKARLLDYRNSGDIAGDKTSVVGYGAVAFYQPEGTPQTQEHKEQALKAEERRMLLELARKTVTEVATKGRLPAVDAAAMPSELKENKACFVTLTKNGSLRGCIGQILPREPLYQAVMDSARSAAVEDPRFMPIGADELEAIKIEISVLTLPHPLEFASWQDLLGKLRPNVDGVILQIGPRSATYLPQVWEQIPDKEEFMSSLAQKAGCDRDAWKHQGVSVRTYQVEAFAESEKH